MSVNFSCRMCKLFLIEFPRHPPRGFNYKENDNLYFGKLNILVYFLQNSALALLCNYNSPCSLPLFFLVSALAATVVKTF